MVKIVNLDNILEGKPYGMALAYNNNIILMERINLYIDELDQFNKIIKLNYETKKIDEFKFDKPIAVGEFSFINSSPIMYYAVIDKLKHELNIYIVNYDTFESHHILSLNTDTRLFGIQLVGLNDRYCIIKSLISEGLFEKMILIDAVENKSYEIPKSIGNNDDISRIDEIVTISGNEYFIVKTGATCDSEKYSKWKVQNKSGVFANYGDALENLILYDINEFVQNVKQELPMVEGKILETCDLHSGMRIIKCDEKKVIYSVQSFKNKTTYIKIFDLESQESKCITIEGLYDYMQYFNKKIYGLIRDEQYADVYDVITKKKLLRVKGMIIYFDDDYAIGTNVEFENETIYYLLTKYSLSAENKIEKLKISSYCFDYDKNILFIKS